MRKFLLSILAVMLSAVLPAFAAIDYTLGPEDFESGQLPSGWSIDTVSGNAAWSFQTGESMTYPTGAFAGSLGRAVCIDPVSGTGNVSVSRLISPAVSLAAVYQPQLVFSYAQVGLVMSTGATLIDTLKVYFRKSPTSEWTLIPNAVPLKAQNSWKQMIVNLPQTSGTSQYQIAFEATCTSGNRGVVLDNVYVRPTSTCNVSDLTASPTSSEAFIEFISDQMSFETLITTAAIRDWDNIDSTTIAYSNNALAVTEFTVTDLTPFTNYIVYVRGTCEDNESGYTDWISTTFKTTQRLDTLPYREDFEAALVDEGWNVFAGTASVPALQATSANYSIDGSASLAFANVPAGKYCYAVSPEINVPITGCEVSFWGTAYDKVSGGAKQYASELSVGVMSDINDWTTFTEVEKVHIESAYQFKKFHVSLAGYTGTGKYVVLASNAVLPNTFYVDNFEITAPGAFVPECVVKNVLPTGFTVAPVLNGATSWNVKVSPYYVANGAPASDSCLVEFSNLASAEKAIVLPDSLAGSIVLVYVQGMQGSVASEWSFPVTLRVPTAVAEIPFTLDFNANDPKIRLSLLNNQLRTTSTAEAYAGVFFPLSDFTYNFPKVSTSAPTFLTGGHVEFKGIDAYMVLPYVESLDSLELVFRLAVGSTSSSYEGSSRVAVGVMTDPYDASTFTQIGTFDGTSQYLKCVADLSAYDGLAHYVAIKAISPAKPHATYGSYNALDAVTLRKFPTCHEVANVVSTPGTTYANIAWAANNMSSWRVALYREKACRNLLRDTTVLAPSVRFDELAQHTTYYFTVQTVCGSDTIDVEDVYQFTTLFGIPFTENFNALTAGIPAGWSNAEGTAADTYRWAYHASGQDGACVRFNSYTASNGATNVLATPTLYIDAPARLTFSWKNPTGGNFAVQISSDGGATRTTLLDSLVSQTAWKQEIIDLAAYEGQNITIYFFATSNWGSGDAYIYLDNVVVKAYNPNCAGVTQLSAIGSSSTTATINWRAQGTQSVDIKVATDAAFTNVVIDTAYTVNPIQLTGLTSNTRYYVRARQTCDTQGDWMTADFKTMCSALTPADLGVLDFSNSDALDCWTVGYLYPSHSTSDTYNQTPKVRNVPGFGNVLEITKSASTSYSFYADGQYAIMPELAVGDSLNLYEISFNACTNSTSTSNVKQIAVGVITVPGDFSTFVNLHTFNLSEASDSTAMQSYTLDLAEYLGDDNDEMGRYLMFYSVADSAGSNSVLIDNVEVTPRHTCPQLLGATVDSIWLTGAHVTWAVADTLTYEVMVTASAVRPDTVQTPVFRTTVDVPEVLIQDLNPSSDYYVYVRTICAEGDTARWSPFAKFHTPRGVPYYEAVPSSFPSDWRNASGEVTSVLRGAPLGTGSKWLIRETCDGQTALDGYAFKANIYSTGCYAWLISPELDLSNLSSNTGVQLSFAASFTKYSSSSVPAQPDLNAPDDRMLVLFSTDGGQTWDSTSYVEWGAQGANTEYHYLDIPYAGEVYNIDMSQYVGGKVTFAFYGESTVSNADNDLYIDEIHVRAYDNSCQGVKNLKAEQNGAEVMVSWTTTDVTDRIVELSDDALFQSIIRRDTTSLDTIVFSGLVPSYEYYVRVMTECGSEWKSTSFKTMLGVPFLETFDEVSAIPENWTRLTGDLFGGTAATATTGWTFKSSGNYAGMSPNYLAAPVTYNKNTRNEYTLLLPELQLTSQEDNDLILSFDMALTGSATNSTAPTAARAAGRAFYVVARVAGDSVWNIVEEWSETDTTHTYVSIPNAATNYQVNLSEYANQAVQLGFFHSIGTCTTSGNACIFLDNVRIQSLNLACAAPEVAPYEASPDSLVLHLNGEAGTYFVQLSSGPTFANVLDSVVVTDTLVSFGGLEANTLYYVRAKGICGEKTSSWSEVVSVRTACGVISALPWQEGFELHEVGSSSEGPLCWNLVGANEGSYPYVYVNNNADYVQSGNKALYLVSSRSKDAYILLPEFEAPVNTLALYFSHKAQSLTNSGTLKVGYMVDTVFYAVDSLERDVEWTRAQVFYSALPDTLAGARLAICFGKGGANDYKLGIDDITVDLAPTCLPLKNVVTVDSVSINSARVLIAPEAGNYLVQYAANPNFTQARVDTVLNDSVVVLRDLTPSTTYYVRAAVYCGEGDASVYGDSVQFATFRGIPYVENFDAMSTGRLNNNTVWLGYRGSDYTVNTELTPTASTVSTSEFGWNVQSISQYVSGMSGKGLRTEIYSSSYNAFATTPFIFMNPDSVNTGIRLSFNVAAVSFSGSATPIADSQDHTFSVLVSTDGVNYEPIAIWSNTGDYSYNDIKNAAVHYEIDLTEYANRNISLGFLTAAETTTPDTYFWLDDVAIMHYNIPSCIAPKGLKLADIAATSATFSWKGNSEQYQVVVLEDGALFDSADTITVDTTVVELVGLLPTTTYVAYVRALCGDGDMSEWTESRPFTTSCLAYAPITYDFEDPTNDGTECWMVLGSSSSYTPSIKTNVDMDPAASRTGYGYAYSGDNAVYFYTYSGTSSYSYAIMPELSIPLDSLQLQFYGRAGYVYESYSTTGSYGMYNASSSYARTIQVGTMTDPSKPSTFELLATFTEDALDNYTDPGNDPLGNNYWRLHKVPLHGATGKFIAFRAAGLNSSNYYCIDQVSVDYMPACADPTRVRAASVTDSAAVITWLGSAASYQVRVNGDNANLITVLTDTVVLTNLQSASMYTVEVRALCSATELSDWTSPITFVTPCSSFAMPFEESFDALTAGIPMCWDNSEGTTTNNSYKWSYYATGASGSGLRFNSYINSDGNTNVLATPVIRLDEDAILNFTYKNPTGGDFKVTIAEAGQATRNILANNLTGQADWATMDINLRAYTGKSVIIYFEATSNYGDGDAYIYLDDVVVAPVPVCEVPSALTLASATDGSLTISWTGNSDNYVAQISEVLDFASVYDSVLVDTSATATFAGLSPATLYYVRVKGVCSATEESRWSKVFACYTDCGAIKAFPWQVNFETRAAGDFDDPCWSNVHVAGSSDYIFKVSTTTQNSNSTHMLQLPDMQAGNITRLTLPTMQFAQDGLYRLTLDVYRSHYSTSKPNEGIRILFSTAAGEATVARIIRQYDLASTQVPAEAVAGWYTYTFTLPSVDGLANIIFEGISEYGTATYVDNIKVVEVNTACPGIDNITIGTPAMNGTVVSFSYLPGGSTDAYLELSKSASFARVELSDTIRNDSTYVLPQLDPSTTYYVRIKQLCADGEESGYESTSFETPIGVPYTPEFSSTTLTGDWLRSSTAAGDVFTGTPMTFGSSSWSLVASDTVISSIHFRGNIYGPSWHYWMITPSIDMSTAAGQGMVLSFDAGLTPYSQTASTVAKRNDGVDDRFIVAITTDNGATWLPENATIWNNAGTGDYVYNDVPEHGATYRIDLTRFAGQSVRIGFYGESSAANADNYFHFGNIRLTACEATTLEDVVCEGYDYDNNGFVVPAEGRKNGLNTYSIFEPGAAADGSDIMTVLNLTQYPRQNTVIERTVCEGEPVDEGNFHIASASRSTILADAYEGANGCDSIVELHLTVIPSLHTDTTIRLCRGEEFTHNGETYFTNQIIRDTLSSAATGCDSIHTIYLEFSATATSTTTIRTTLCYDDSIQVGDQYFAQPGNYTVHLTTAFGCDSIVELHLMQADSLGEYRDTITLEQLPYFYGEDELLGTNVGPGSYGPFMKGTTCGTAVSVYVVVLGPDALDDIYGGQRRIRKVVIDGHIFIMVDDRWYDSTGRMVEMR